MNVAQQDMIKALLNQGKTQEEIKKFLLVSNPTQQVSDEEIAEISNPDQKKKEQGALKEEEPGVTPSEPSEKSSESTPETSEEPSKKQPLVTFSPQLEDDPEPLVNQFRNYLLDVHGTDKNERGEPMIGVYTLSDNARLAGGFGLMAFEWAKESGLTQEGENAFEDSPKYEGQFVEFLEKEYGDYERSEEDKKNYLAGSIYMDISNGHRDIIVNNPDALPSEITDKIRKFDDDYVNEIIPMLGFETEDQLEELSELMYENYDFRLNFDGDELYNEDVPALLAPAAALAAGSIDMISGAVSLTVGPVAWLVNKLDGDSSNDKTYGESVADIDQVFTNVTDGIRKHAMRDYQDYGFEEMAENPLHGIGWMAQGIAESAPIMAASIGAGIATGGASVAAQALAGGVAIAGIQATNTFVDSYREDLNATREGMTPVFDMTASGHGKRFLMALGSGIIEGGSGIILRGAVGRVAGKGGTHDVFRKIFLGTKNPRTRLEQLLIYGGPAFAEVPAETMVEVSAQMYRDWTEYALGNKDYDPDQIWENALKTAEASVVTTAGLSTAGTGVAMVRESGNLSQGSRIDTNDPYRELEIENMTNSPADEGNYMRMWYSFEGEGVDFRGQAEANIAMADSSPFDLDEASTTQDYIDAYENHRKTNRDKYRAIRLRDPKRFSRLLAIDRQLARIVQTGRLAEANMSSETLNDRAIERNKNKRNQKRKEFIDLMDERRRLYMEFEFNNDFSKGEQIQIDDQQTASRVNQLDGQVTDAETALAAAERAQGGEAGNPLIIKQKEEDLQSARDRRDRANELVTEVNSTRDEIERMQQRGAPIETLKKYVGTLIDTEQELADLLEINNRATGNKRKRNDMEVVTPVERPVTWSAADQARNHFADEGSMGSTFTLDGTDHAGKPMASVSIFPERSIVVDGQMSEADLIAKLDEFKETNKDILEGNEDVIAIGTFYSPESEKTFIDLSAVVDKETAVELGKQYNQESVWDLENMEAIDTGGDGSPIEGLKPEADRVGDIRDIQGPPAVNVQQAKTQRGIDGKYKDYQMNNGQFVIGTDSKLSQEDIDFINKKIAPTLSRNLDNVTIRVHTDKESGKYVAGDKSDGSLYNGYAVTYKDGSAVIHIVPDAIAGQTRKSTRSVLMEEAMHVIMGPALVDYFKSNEKGAQKLLTDLAGVTRSLAREFPELSDLNEQTALKMTTYADGKDFSELSQDQQAAIYEEAVFEQLSELAPYIDKNTLSKQQKSKFMDVVNRLAKHLGFPFVTTPDEALDLLKRAGQMYNEGKVLEADVSAQDRESASRSNVRKRHVQSLPANDQFVMRYTQKQIARTGQLAGLPTGNLTYGELTFNGKSHFINWWKRATLNGKHYDYYGSFEVSTDGGKTFEAVDVEAMRNWNFKPLKRRETESEKRRRLWEEEQAINRKVMDLFRDEYGTEWGLYKKKQQVQAEIFKTFMTEEEIEAHLDSAPYGRGKERGDYDWHSLSTEKKEEFLAAAEVYTGRRNDDSGSDVLTESANKYLMDVNEIMSIEDLNERTEKMKKMLSRYKCGGDTNACEIRGDKAYLAVYLDMVKAAMDQSGYSVNAAADLLSGMLRFHNDLRMSRGQRPITEIHKENRELAEMAADMIAEKYAGTTDIIPRNYKDFNDLFLTTMAITSNGNRSYANTRLALRLHDAFLKRLNGGAQSLSEAMGDVILEGIREYNPEVTGGDVRATRGNAVADELKALMEFADAYYDPETMAFDADAFAADLGKKRIGKDGPAAREIISKEGGDAQKIGEFVPAILGQDQNSTLANELWVMRLMSALQGNFDLKLDMEGEQMLLDYSLIPNVQEFNRNNKITDDMARQGLASVGRENASEITDPVELAIGGLIYQKARKDITQAQRNSAINLFRKVIGRDQLFSPKANPKETKAILRKTAKLLNEMYGLAEGDQQWNAFIVQQALWESAQESMGYFQDGQYSAVDYKSQLERIKEADDWSTMDDYYIDTHNVGHVLDSHSNSKNVSSERASMQLDLFGDTQSDLEIQADQSPLWRARTIENVPLVNTKTGKQAMSDDLVSDALQTDKTSVRIMEANNEVNEGDIVAVRLNLNVKKNTGVPVQTIHERTASGKALQYGGAVTLSNVTLDVNQNAREKIVTFRENKFPMAAVRGEFVSSGVDGANLDGVVATFNPFKQHLFVDAAGRPIKSAEEATVIGNTVILRGEIEYYDPSDPVAQRGFQETDANKAARLDKGSDKYEGNLRRFEAFMERAMGVTYETREQLEAAYEDLSVSSKVALSESEIAEGMATAHERASVSEYTDGKRLRGTAGRMSKNFGTDTRSQIINNPENFIKPQKIKEIREDLTAYTDGELVSFMTDDSIGRLSQRNDDIGVLAGAELLSRAIARGETDRIPGLIAELASIGTSAGRILRHFRELKSSSPYGLAKIIESAVVQGGNKLSEEQTKRLNDICTKLYDQQKKVEELMKKGIAGEDVDAEFEAALKEMQATERQLDTFANAMVEKGWGTIFKQLVQGNLLTPFSQIVNVGANTVNLFGQAIVDTGSLPVEEAMVRAGNLIGKNLERKRKPSLMAYFYAMKRFGAGFVEAADQIVTGQDKDRSEWRMARGFAPFRSLMAVWGNDLPLGVDGKGSPSQKAKLIVQGTLGIPAETMFRFLSLGDIPFRRWAEAKHLYQLGVSRGLEGEALNRFLKFPNKKDLEVAQRSGRKLTFQEEGFASGVVNQTVGTMESALAKGFEMIPGVKNGRNFATAIMGVVLPYRSTPANILQETFTWTNPYVGLTRMANELSKGETEEASKTMTKMMLGATTLEAAMMMISEGIISGPVDWRDDEKRNMAYDIFPPNSINVSALERLINGEDPSHSVDDTFVRYDKLGMFGAIMATAVQSIDPDDLADIKGREYGGPVEFTSHLLSDYFGASSVSAASAMMEQSFVQGLNQFLQILIGDNVERDMERFVTTAFRAGSAAVLPNTLTSLYKSERVFLPDSRTTKDMTTAERILKKFEYTLKERTFGMSDVPIRVDWKGQDIVQTPRGANGYFYEMFDLTRARQGSADPLSNEIWRLYEQTEELADVCSTPGYAEKRAVAVPNITSKRDLRLKAALPRQYSWMEDEEFMAESVYLNTEQINRLMKISGQNRYNAAMAVVESPEYKNANDQDRIEMLKDVNDEYNGAKEYNDEGFEAHTIELFNIIQDIYDGRSE